MPPSSPDPPKLTSVVAPGLWRRAASASCPIDPHIGLSGSLGLGFKFLGRAPGPHLVILASPHVDDDDGGGAVFLDHGVASPTVLEKKSEAWGAGGRSTHRFHP